MDEYKHVVQIIRQESRSICNRLNSIKHDSAWVQDVCEAYYLPLIPNERCGLWYCYPELVKDSCYFKSTDGHITQWSFSSRRLNFHLFDIIIKNNGIIIVDSTRRGKSMPDALSKTIPIWCATINYFMFGESDNNWLFVPKQCISESEYDSMKVLIPQFARNLNDLGIITKDELSLKFQGKYLRPLWIYPGMCLPIEPIDSTDFYPVVNCVASMKAQDGTMKLNGFDYVQGAADDHELWSHGLTADVFWENINPLTGSKTDEEIIKLINGLEKKKANTESSIIDQVQMTDKVSVGKVIGNITLPNTEGFNFVILLSKTYKFDVEESSKLLLHYPLAPDKKSANELRKYLPELVKKVNDRWNSINCLILCDTGMDLSIGITLILLSLHYDLNWNENNGNLVTKTTIKKHLAKILIIKKVNPSRSTLQSINSYLM